MEVLDGEFKGRKVWDRLEHQQPGTSRPNKSARPHCSPSATQPASQLQDSAQLHNKPMRIRVTIKKSEGYEPSNEVKGYEAITGTGGAAFFRARFPAGAATAGSARSNTPPWAAAAGGRRNHGQPAGAST